MMTKAEPGRRYVDWKQLGQGMTEYIIIVALVAIGSVGVYAYFSRAAQGHVGEITASLLGIPEVVQGNAIEVDMAARNVTPIVQETIGLDNYSQNAYNH